MNQNKNLYLYFIIDCIFGDWIIPIIKYTEINYLAKRERLINDPNIRIIPLDIGDRCLYENDERMIFKMNVDNARILENKCIFAKFMMEFSPNNIPKTISIKNNTIDYIDPEYKNSMNTCRKMIRKEATGFAGYGTYIIYNFVQNRKNDVVISDYIEHNDFYTGHYLVLKGEVIKSIFFKSSTDNDPNYIQRGLIMKYTILEAEQIEGDLTIFDKIFKELKYSGFACPNFIIVDKKIIIFEINPRPGGSLIHNEYYCNDFFQKIIDMQISE
jgi:hypothetical protein